MALTGVKTMNYLKETDELLAQTMFIRSRIYKAIFIYIWLRRILIAEDEPFCVAIVSLIVSPNTINMCLWSYDILFVLLLWNA